MSRMAATTAGGTGGGVRAVEMSVGCFSAIVAEEVPSQDSEIDHFRPTFPVNFENFGRDFGGIGDIEEEVGDSLFDFGAGVVLKFPGDDLSG